MIQIKRAYEAPDDQDGHRILVERLWPRGIKKEDLQIEAWLKDVAPSTTLRKWFNHQLERWPEFVARYHAELEAQPEGWQPLLSLAQTGPLTLIYSARDTTHNSALVLRDFLQERLTPPA